MNDRPWQKLEGIDVASARFPAPARVDDEGILVFRVKDGFRGVERSCPHLQASLHDAVIMGNGTMLRCTKHHFTFRLSDGKGVNCIGHRLKIFEIIADGDHLFARSVLGSAAPV
jgi:nitrite reductase/ring-hydroxylating ferredoxin subunit